MTVPPSARRIHERDLESRSADERVRGGANPVLLRAARAQEVGARDAVRVGQAVDRRQRAGAGERANVIG